MILDAFVDRVRASPLDTAQLPEILIRDGLPGFLDRLAADLDRAGAPEEPATRHEPATVGGEHGEQRQALGVDVVQVAREWAVLFDVILEILIADTGAIDLSECRLLSRHIHGASIEAIRVHVAVTGRETSRPNPEA